MVEFELVVFDAISNAASPHMLCLEHVFRVNVDVNARAHGVAPLRLLSRYCDLTTLHRFFRYSLATLVPVPTTSQGIT